MRKQSCKCPICKTQVDLILNLKNSARTESFRRLATDLPIFQEFSGPLDLFEHLRHRDLDADHLQSVDRILRCLVRSYGAGLGASVIPELLALAFVPVLHSMYWEVCISFQDLSPEDVAQQAMVALFEVARLPAIQNLNHHVSVTFARTLRTTVRRWAMKQSREHSDSEPIDNLDLDAPELTAEGNFEDALIFHDLLNRCYADGSVSMENYELFLKLKLDGFAAKEVAGSTGELSPKAVHRRIERTIKLLRRQASL